MNSRTESQGGHRKLCTSSRTHKENRERNQRLCIVSRVLSTHGFIRGCGREPRFPLDNFTIDNRAKCTERRSKTPRERLIIIWYLHLHLSCSRNWSSSSPSRTNFAQARQKVTMDLYHWFLWETRGDGEARDEPTPSYFTSWSLSTRRTDTWDVFLGGDPSGMEFSKRNANDIRYIRRFSSSSLRVEAARDRRGNASSDTSTLGTRNK